MAAHPGIVFKPGPTGRRAAAFSGPDVWEIINVFRDLPERGEDAVQRMTEIAPITAFQVRTALRYYAEYRDEIDERIALNDRVLAEVEAAWRRREALLTH